MPISLHSIDPPEAQVPMTFLLPFWLRGALHDEARYQRKTLKGYLAEVLTAEVGRQEAKRAALRAAEKKPRPKRAK